jgi:O-acetyl-ADP-ribose deacetylase (regulator of RNase III)
VQFVQVEPYIWVANMVGQRGIKRGSSGPPIRYEAVAACLRQVAVKAHELEASVHMPRIGCGLAGGEWSNVEPLIEEHLGKAGVAVSVYDFE